MLSKQGFSNLFLTPTGYWPDNIIGEITPYLLRSGIMEFFDAQTHNWPIDTSGILGSDSAGFIGAVFNSVSSAPDYREGTVFYDTENKTFALYNDQPDVTLQLGQEIHVRCVNKTGNTIGNGSAVYINGAQGNRPTVDLAIANDVCAGNVIGVATHDILKNQEGLITTDGVVGSLTLSGFMEGDILYLSPTISGFYTNVEPQAPIPAIHISHVLSNHAVQGKMLVHIESANKITQACDVNGTTPENGYVLGYDSLNGYWDPTNILNASGGFRFGDYTGGNYAEFEEDTGFLRFYGSGIAWDDLRGPFNGAQINSAAGRVGYNFDENTVDFQSNATSSDTVNLLLQMQHDYAPGTTIEPHLHWIQNQNNEPAWRVDYRVYPNGGQAPGWTTAEPDLPNIYTYTSGNMLQITPFPPISGGVVDGFGVSWFIDVKVYRDAASDTYTGDAAGKEYDIHYQRNDRGSRQEYIK